MAKAPTKPEKEAVTSLTTTVTLPYDYENSGNQPPSGKLYQSNSALGTVTISYTDNSGVNHQPQIGNLAVGDTISLNGVTWTITTITLRGSNVLLAVTPAVAAPPTGVTNVTFTSAATNVEVFPLFTPIVPPPLIGQGGGPPPNFPPPTPPPIGTIPSGVLVGPVVAAAAVPPSVAGFPLIQYKSGSATSPTAASWLFQFTSTFPKPTVVFSNVYTGGKPPTTPPSTASTLNIVLGGWGPNVPAGAPTTPGGDGRLPRSLTGLLATDGDDNGKKRKKAA